ncbi:metallophosphoesterase [Rufibacter radiotolerans]|uniref:Metallophosphoesterase n=1 Tax=Rufibacter radiotolerans TaxID=1379910 RepID=A0A0H4W820_9BACT|nr:calcineurin-like phosphoesterase family protein [Rufibacter radiotolerans]AKQ46561.1 metallophosphoesterase [Rufibacter radiotolerans]
MKRRVFLQNLVLATGALFVSSPGVFAHEKASRQKLKGTVTAKGAKLKDVVVSDGFSVVTTDRKGRFELPMNPKARFVFLSVPAGYAFPQENSLARHYLPIQENANYNFDLTPLNQDDTRHKFIVWADPQVKNANDVKLMMQESVPDVQKLVQAMGPDTLVHGMSVGDLVWDELALFQDYNKAVAAMGIPFFQALGNHDMDYRLGGDETSDATFQKVYGPTYYSFNRGKVHYIVLDDVRYLGTERDYDGHVSEQQLAWLKQDLAFVPKDHLVILNLHIPVFLGVKNKKDLLKTLKGYQVHIMSGHTHYNQNIVQDGVFEHVHGTVCGAWWTGPICTDGTPGGYGVYEVDGNQLKWHYKSTGLPSSHQVSLHVETLTNQKRLMANVWNYDPAWKVEWFADGVRQGELKQTTGFDPVTITMFEGPKRPAKRGFAEPAKTDHLFMAHFSPTVKTVRVVATDRFGTTFENQIEIA